VVRSRVGRPAGRMPLSIIRGHLAIVGGDRGRVILAGSLRPDKILKSPQSGSLWLLPWIDLSKGPLVVHALSSLCFVRLDGTM
jgi:hypothetical protein